MVKSCLKKVPQSARLSAGGGVIAIWAMPTWRGGQAERCFPYWCVSQEPIIRLLSKYIKQMRLPAYKGNQGTIFVILRVQCTQRCWKHCCLEILDAPSWICPLIILWTSVSLIRHTSLEVLRSAHSIVGWVGCMPVSGHSPPHPSTPGHYLATSYLNCSHQKANLVARTPGIMQP